MPLRAEEEESKVQTSGRDRQTRPTIRQNVILPWQIIACRPLVAIQDQKPNGNCGRVVQVQMLNVRTLTRDQIRPLSCNSLVSSSWISLSI